ncbi:MAG: hypothetical protein K6G81_06575 [Lachnospiraceae bacterium]|nr:hypothetical protein [Lachnospiraceae bacterium]
MKLTRHQLLSGLKRTAAKVMALVMAASCFTCWQGQTAPLVPARAEASISYTPSTLGLRGVLPNNQAVINEVFSTGKISDFSMTDYFKTETTEKWYSRLGAGTVHHQGVKTGYVKQDSTALGGNVALSRTSTYKRKDKQYKKVVKLLKAAGIINITRSTEKTASKTAK